MGILIRHRNCKTTGPHDCVTAGLDKMKNEKWRINNYFKRKNYSLFIINYKFKYAVAFTLAEVLITLGIIGVVAAVVMPSMITNITERKNSEREANIAQKITQAMENMRATGTLIQYDSTESFVSEIKKHLKIAKICDKDHLTDCWPTEKVIGSDGNEYAVADVKKGIGLGIFTSTNNVGIVLADGAPIILNYDNTAHGFDVGDRIEVLNKDLPIGNDKVKTFAYTTNVTGAIDYVTDVNGKSKPNREKNSATNKYYDIRSFRVAGFSGIQEENGPAGKIVNIGKSYTAVNCTDSSSIDYKYCGDNSSGKTKDYWAGALKACEKIGMHLPTQSELTNIYKNKSEYPSIKSNTGWFTSSTESPNDPKHLIRSVYFGRGGGYDNHAKTTHSRNDVMCLY